MHTHERELLRLLVLIINRRLKMELEHFKSMITSRETYSPVSTLVQILDWQSGALGIAQRLIVGVRVNVASARDSMDVSRDLS